MTKRTVDETMTRKIVTINVNEGIETAYRRMQRRGTRHLPVSDDSGEIVGMLSDRDVQRAMISEVRGSAGTRVPATEIITFDPAARVRDYMGWPVMTIEQGSDLKIVVERLLKEKISALLVKDGDRSVGIVTTDDLLRVLHDLLGDPKTPVRWTLHGLLEDSSRRLEDILV